MHRAAGATTSVAPGAENGAVRPAARQQIGWLERPCRRRRGPDHPICSQRGQRPEILQPQYGWRKHMARGAGALRAMCREGTSQSNERSTYCNVRRELLDLLRGRLSLDTRRVSAPDVSEPRKVAALTRLDRARRRISYGYWACGGLIIAAVGLALVSPSTANTVLAVVCAVVALLNLWFLRRFLRRIDTALVRLQRELR